jgi:two-component system OmpR family sensor kinase
MVLAIVVSSVATTVVLGVYLTARAESQIQATSDRLTGALEALDGLTIPIDELDRYVGDSGIAIVETDGQVTAAVGISESEAARLIGTTAASTGPVAVEGDTPLIALRSDVSGLGLSIDDGAGDGIPVDHLILVSNTSAAREASDALILINTITAFVVIAVLVTLAAVLVTRGLRPLRLMADRADAVATGDRTTRMPTSDDDPQIVRLASTVNAAFDAQQDAENTVRAFVADASHELRTPLTTASGWVDLYLQGGLTDEAHRDHAMQRVQAQLGRMRTLVEELSVLARLDAGRSMESEHVDLRSLADEIVEDARVVDGHREFTLVAPEPAHMLGDAPRLLQVLRNLVGNATQHTPPGTAVIVSVEAGTTAHTISVTDHGHGIAPEAVPHLFERFWRQDSSRARDSGGSGLGLAIVQSIVTAHGGTIAVASSSTGTTMTVTLPASLPLD